MLHRVYEIEEYPKSKSARHAVRLVETRKVNSAGLSAGKIREIFTACWRLQRVHSRARACRYVYY